jgi:hypothetical protein
VDVEGEGSARRYWVSCGYCGATGAELPTYDLAITGWNRATVSFECDLELVPLA